MDAAAVVEEMIEVGYQDTMEALTFNWLIVTQVRRLSCLLLNALCVADVCPEGLLWEVHQGGSAMR